jgi:CDP-diacylglycerol---glycerol-3-phosphate 3-phosphatidyltransferase
MSALSPRRIREDWNLPNAITTARIVVSPFFFWILLADGGRDGWLRWVAAVLFVVAIGTDGIDGHIARSRGLVTDLGKLLDPIADKLITSGALVCLSILLELPWWVTLVILVREIGITVHRLVVADRVVIAAAWPGKLKTVLQSVAITLALAPFWTVFGEWVYLVNAVFMTAALALTIFSGIDYFLGLRRGRAAGASGVA